MITLLADPTGAYPTVHAQSVPPVKSPSALLLQAAMALPAEPAWVPIARRFTLAVLTRWQVPVDERDAAVLVVSELTGNAARHGRSAMTLHLALDGETLHITVGDHGQARRAEQPDPDHDPDEHGRGIPLVHALATRVNTLEDDRGRRVQAALHTGSR